MIYSSCSCSFLLILLLHHCPVNDMFCMQKQDEHNIYSTQTGSSTECIETSEGRLRDKRFSEGMLG